jgi:hypothetical protein
VTVDVLAAAGIASDHERMEPGRPYVADQARTAVADGHVRAIERLGERLLVEEVLARCRDGGVSAAVLNEHLHVWMGGREVVAP